MTKEYPTLESRLKFTKEEIYSKGFCSFDGETAMQHYNAFYYLWDLIEDMRPNKLIEIGTAAGGLTRFLKCISDELNLNAKVISYDVNDNPARNKLLDIGVDYRQEDCFDKKNEHNLYRLAHDISSEGKALVLCDGGHKITEFNKLANFLKTGDVIMAHDYSLSREVFKSEIHGKIWNWCEVTYEDIKDTVEKNHLKPHLSEKFSQAVWACFIKE